MPTFTPPAVSDATAGDLLDGPFQAELRGVLFDSSCDNGLIVTRFLDGFGVPQTRNQDVEKSRRHGLYASPQYLGGRPMLVEVAAVGTDLDDLMTQKANLGWAWQPISDTDTDYVVPLTFTLGQLSDAFLVWGKPIRAEWNYDLLARTYLHSSPFADAAVCEFLATDPRLYSLPLQSASTGVGAASGGWGWAGGPGSYPDDGGWPHGWGSATPGTATATNGGNFQTMPVITIAAGAASFTNPTLSNLTTGESWSIALAIAAGDTLVVDMGAQTALLNGTASRDSLIVRPPSDWWALEPGANTVQLGGTGATGTATIEWRDAWLL